MDNKVSDTKAKILLIVTLVMSVALVALRFVQVKNYIDPETGFYTGDSVFNYIVMALVAAVIVFAFVYVPVTKCGKELSVENKKSKTWFVAVFAAIGFICDGASAVVQYFVAAATDADSQTAVNVAKISLLGRFVFAILAAVYFFIVSGDEKNGNGKAEKMKILALSPVIWSSFRLLALFVTKIAYIKVSDLFYLIIALAFTTLFLMNYAQFRSNVYSSKVHWKLYTYGTVAAIVMLMITVPKVAFQFIDGGSYINSDYPLNICDIILPVYIICFLFGSKISVTEETKPVVPETKFNTAVPQESAEKASESSKEN